MENGMADPVPSCPGLAEICSKSVFPTGKYRLMDLNCPKTLGSNDWKNNWAYSISNS